MLDKPQYPHGLGEIGITIICQTGLAEILGANDPERAAWARDLDSVIIPIDAHRCVGRFISSMQDRVAHELLERGQWVRLAALFHGATGQVDAGPVVRNQLFIDAPQDVVQDAVDRLLVGDGIAQAGARNPQELNVGTR